MSSADLSDVSGVGRGLGSPQSAPDVDAQDIIDIIECPADPVENPTTWETFGRGGELPRLQLPGYGKARYGHDVETACNETIGKFCRHCGKYTAVEHSCDRSVCPKCADQWCKEQGVATVAKLIALRAYKDAASDPQQLYHHLVVSPPDDVTFGTDDPLDRAFEVVKDVVKTLGGQGKAFFHSWRGSNGDDKGDDRGYWKTVQFKGRDWEDVRSELEFAPHFHVIVVSPFIQGAGIVEEIEEETGWVIHRITQGTSNVSIGNNYDLARAVTYCLSHTGVIRADEHPDRTNNRVATRWFGADVQNVEVYDRTEEEADALVRRVAPDVLGIPFSQLACTAEVEDPDRQHVESGRQQVKMNHEFDEEDLDRAERLLRQSQLDSLPEMIPDDSSTVIDSIAGTLDIPDSVSADHVGGISSSSIELVDEASDLSRNAPLLRTSTQSTSTDGGDDREIPGALDGDQQTQRCEGGLEHISQAPDYLNDDDWVQQAEFADELRHKYREWDDGPPD